jgi:hypothetical protein
MQKLRFLFGSMVLVLAATFALAQTGAIQGTVTDSVGAVVQGAEITVKNLGSNATRTSTSNGTGDFSIPSLAPGAYEATVKMASFKAFHVTNVVLSVGQVLSLNVQARSRKKSRCGPISFPTLIWRPPRSATWWIRG